MGDILGLISAGSGAITSIAGNIGYGDKLQDLAANQMQVNANAAADTYRYSEMAANNADARTRALYNDLQSPAARAQQLRDAGLSIGLMYGQGGSGGSLSSGAQGSGATVAPAQLPMPPQVLNAEVATMIANAAKTTAEVENIKADTANKTKDLSVKDQQVIKMQQEVEEMKVSINKDYEEINNIIANTLKTTEETKNVEKQGNVLDAQTALNKAQAELAEIDIKSREDLNEETINKLKAGIKELEANAKKLGADTKTINELRGHIVKKAMYDALIAEYDNLEIQPKEREKLAAEIKSLNLANLSEEAYQQVFENLGKQLGEGGGAVIAKFLQGMIRILKSL